MTLKSLRFSLFQQLYSRYAIEPAPAADSLAPAPGVFPGLSPIIDISDLYDLEPRFDTLDVQASVGNFVAAWTVPDGQRWHIKYITKPATSANCILLLVGPDGTSGLTETINLTPADTSLTLLQSHQFAAKLDAGWQIGLSTTGNAGDSGRVVKTLFLRERLN